MSSGALSMRSHAVAPSDAVLQMMDERTVARTAAGYFGIGSAAGSRMTSGDAVRAGAQMMGPTDDTRAGGDWRIDVVLVAMKGQGHWGSYPRLATKF